MWYGSSNRRRGDEAEHSRKDRTCSRTRVRGSHHTSTKPPEFMATKLARSERSGIATTHFKRRQPVIVRMLYEIHHPASPRILSLSRFLVPRTPQSPAVQVRWSARALPSAFLALGILSASSLTSSRGTRGPRHLCAFDSSKHSLAPAPVHGVVEGSISRPMGRVTMVAIDCGFWCRLLLTLYTSLNTMTLRALIY
ncbi:hypothetical protein EDC01DRAFT_679812 [Geopyxis carbonaria]|nr:hypothetical protein EDC01DRAFT_679812 [Geopyxis carbonaria]